jgi:hypothetical protein
VLNASAPGLSPATAILSVTQGSGAPLVIAKAPSAGANGVSVSTAVSATFNQSVAQSPINFVLTDYLGNRVQATLSYNDATRVAKLQPNSPLAPSTNYTAVVSEATNSAGQPMDAPAAWSFTTGSGELGQWSPVYDWPCVSIHTHLLPNGKVLSWAMTTRLRARRGSPRHISSTSRPIPRRASASISEHDY